MPKGGRRPGAGRPKGSKDGAPRRRRVTIAPDPAVAEVLEWAHARCQSGRITQALDEFLESPDKEDRKWAITVGMSYGVGLPGKRAEPQGSNYGELISEAGRRARIGDLISEAAKRARETSALNDLAETPPERSTTPKGLISEGDAPAAARAGSEGAQEASAPPSEPKPARAGGSAPPAPGGPQKPAVGAPAPDPPGSAEGPPFRRIVVDRLVEAPARPVKRPLYPADRDYEP